MDSLVGINCNPLIERCRKQTMWWVRKASVWLARLAVVEPPTKDWISFHASLF